MIDFYKSNKISGVRNENRINAPHDGQAKPQVLLEYLALPFEILEDNLMISLFGELKYE